MSDLRKGAIRLILDSRLDNVWMAGVAIKNVCMQAGITSDTATELEAAVVEAVNNTIIHACHAQPGYSIEILMKLDPEGVLFQIKDHGEGASRLVQREVTVNPDDRASLPEGGYGLMLVYGIMDQVTYRSTNGENILIMTKVLE